MTISLKSELSTVTAGLGVNFVAFQFSPDQWGYAVLLLLAGALLGASIAAYCGKKLGLEDAADSIIEKIIVNVSIVGIFGPAILGWWIDLTGMQLEAAGPMVGGVIAMFGVTALIILIPKILSLLRRINVLRVLGKASEVIEPEAKPTPKI